MRETSSLSVRDVRQTEGFVDAPTPCIRAVVRRFGRPALIALLLSSTAMFPAYAQSDDDSSNALLVEILVKRGVISKSDAGAIMHQFHAEQAKARHEREVEREREVQPVPMAVGTPVNMNVAGAGMQGGVQTAAATPAPQPPPPPLGPNGLPVVTPGSIIVHLNGYLGFQLANFGSTFNTVQTSTGAYKLSNIAADGDFRLYPGFDAETRSGVKYGAYVELRTAVSNAGDAIGTSTTSSGGFSGIYVRRAYAYVGKDKYGTFRFGQGDGPFELLQDGVVETWGDDGQFNSDGGLYNLLPTHASAGNFFDALHHELYSTVKAVYMSPTFHGFSFGVGYEPNSNGIKEGYASNGAASSTSSALSSSPNPSDIGTRRQNTVDGGIQYAGQTADVTYKGSVAYIHGTPIRYDGPPTAVGTPTYLGYDNLSLWQVGGQATINGHLTLGANVKGGATEDGFDLKPKGARNGFTYVFTGFYDIQKFRIGGTFFDGQTSGAYVPGTVGIAPTLTEYGFETGVSYYLDQQHRTSFFAEYIYNHLHQPGNTNLKNGNAQSQAIGIGVNYKWYGINHQVQ